MKKEISLVLLISLSALTPVAVQAENVERENIYLGGGLGFNSLPGFGSSRGFQFFAGYDFDFKLNEDISTAVEIGYMDSGNLKTFNSGRGNDVTGAWASVVESVPLSRKTDMLVRLGYDFGDDDGLLLGTGMQYKFDTKVAFRMEYVTREHLHGLQANLLVHF